MRANPRLTQRRPRPSSQGLGIAKWFLIGTIVAAAVYVMVKIVNYFRNKKSVDPSIDMDKLLNVTIPKPEPANDMPRKFDPSHILDAAYMPLDPINACVTTLGKTNVVRNGRCYTTSSPIDREKNTLNMNGLDKLERACRTARGQMVKVSVPERLDKPDEDKKMVPACLTACEPGYERDPENPFRCIKYEDCPDGMIIKPGKVTTCVALHSITKHARRVASVLDLEECGDLDEENRIDYVQSSGHCLKLRDCPTGWRPSTSNNALCEPDPERWDQQTIWPTPRP